LLDVIVRSFVIFFVIVDPIGVAVIFAGLIPHADREMRRRIAIQAVTIAGVLIFLFGAIGEPVLTALGVTMPAFRIAGGLLLFLLATDMVFARQSGMRKPTAPEESELRHQRDIDIAVFPLAFPLLAGPGALTSIVLSVGRAHGFLEIASVFGSMLIVLGLTLVALLTAGRVTKLLGVTGANVIGRVLGVILAAIAAQYVVDGITQIAGKRQIEPDLRLT
jgi:multiple antibiotic resistance protein